MYQLDSNSNLDFLIGRKILKITGNGEIVFFTDEAETFISARKLILVLENKKITIISFEKQKKLLQPILHSQIADYQILPNDELRVDFNNGYRIVLCSAHDNFEDYTVGGPNSSGVII